MTDLQTTTSIFDAFAEVVAHHRDKVFIETPEAALTVGEFDLLSNRVARAIPASPDRLPVAVMCVDAIDFQVAQVGALKSGRPFMRIHTDEPAVRVALVLEQTGVDTLIVSAGQAVDPLLSGQTVVTMSDLPEDDSPVAMGVRPDDAAMVMHTSGSTGVPKGLIHSYSSLYWRSVGFIQALDLTADDRILLLSRLGTLELGSAVLTGASLHPFDVRRRGLPGLADWLRDARVTVFRSPPSVMRSLVSEVGDLRFPDLRLLVQAGEELTARDIEMLRSVLEPHTALLHFYGTSESGVVTAVHIDGSFDPASGAVTIGTPAPGVTVTIEDARGDPVADGEVGKIVVQSPALASGYVGGEGRSGDRYRADGSNRRFVTGDLGRWTENGELEFHGRDDHQVKVQGGHRVEMGEVEEAIRHLPGIDEAVVVARVADDGTTTLVAYYTNDDPPPRVADLRRALAERLPPYMVPSRWIAMDSFPRTLPVEKIDRMALPDPPPLADLDGSTVAGRLATIWANLLGVTDVAAEDSFFDLGGESLAATALVAEIDRQFDCRLEIADLFGDGTFGFMCEAVETSRRVTPARPLFALKRSGDLPPLHCIHMPGWNPLRYLVLSRAIGDRQPVTGVLDEEVPTPVHASSLTEIARRYSQAIRQAWDGPYLLLGTSSAGVLAYEVGLQISRDGGDVAFVGMIDSGYPGARTPLLTRLRNALHRHGVAGVASIGLARVSRWMRRRRPPAADPDAVREGLEREIVRLHRVTPCDAPVTYFRAADDVDKPHITREWRRLGGHIVDVPGTHATVLTVDQVGPLAIALQEAIAGALMRRGQHDEPTP
ncbi:MAG TPA: AMP-binding protein [Acidimicrobiia bacterium]|nr:AMP-binding protein [Acidimicrobiia bacterium]